MFNRSNKEHFLLEIGTEELPPMGLRNLAGSLHDNICEGIRANGLSFVSSQLYAGPRRIAVLLKSLDPTQAEQQIEKRGPSINAAYTKEGTPTKAAEGFAISCGVSLEDLEVLETDKGSWLVHRKKEAGQPVSSLMPVIIAEAIKKMHISKPMRWGAHEFEFVRPVHWLIAMYGSEVVPMTILGQTAGNLSYGHRFLAPKAIKIKKPEKYLEQLKNTGKVLVDFKMRRETIKQQIFDLSEHASAQPILDEALLDEVTNLVEWPTALLVELDKAFLSVPQVALIAAMQNHQKCFALTDQAGDLLPQFITISNIEDKDTQQVVRGNQKVMRARLSDAKFFYDGDIKNTLESRVNELKNITFEDKLGSLYDRVTRISELGALIAEKSSADVEKVKRVALLCKADLITSMVGEFPSLQGAMGYYYAKHDNEDVQIALAIRDHYKPKSAVDTVSKDPLAYIIGIADKLDLLVGIFGIGNKPTGDKDPYALRRATLGIIRTIIENHLNIDLAELIQASIKTYKNKLVNADVYEDVLQFIYERLRAWYKDQGVNNYIFNAVLAKKATCLQDFAKRVNAIMSFRRLPDARILTEANKRVVNILNKNAEQMTNGQVKVSLLTLEAEKQLAQAITSTFKVANDFYQQQQFTETLRSLIALKTPVADFFEQVMVMDENDDLRQNRLLLLKQLRDLFNMVADISLLQ